MMNIYEIVIVVTGVISSLASLMVIITFAMFQSMRRKRFMKFIFYISLSDFFVGVSSVMGFPSRYSVCFLQGMLCTTFSMCSWLWTVSLSHSLYCIIRSRPSFSDMFLHLICWGLPLVVTFTQLALGTYGIPTPREQWCFLIPYSSSPYWVLTVYFFGLYWGSLFIGVMLMLYWGLVVHWKVYQDLENPASGVIKNAYNKVFWYPIVMIVCWSINFVASNFGTTNLVAFLSMFAGTINALLTAMIFFVHSEEARVRWINLFSSEKARQLSLIISDCPIDFEEDSVYNESFRTQSSSRSASTNTNQSNQSSKISTSSSFFGLEPSHFNRLFSGATFSNVSSLAAGIASVPSIVEMTIKSSDSSVTTSGIVSDTSNISVNSGSSPHSLDKPNDFGSPESVANL